MLLGGTLLLLAAAYVNMSYSPASTLAAWGIDPTALLPAVAQQWWQPEEEVAPVPPDLSLAAATPVYGQLQKTGPSEMVLGVRDGELPAAGVRMWGAVGVRAAAAAAAGGGRLNVQIWPQPHAAASLPHPLHAGRLQPPAAPQP